MRKFAFAAAVVAMFAPSLCSAQVQIDMGRVTCGQYTAMDPDDQRDFSAWMSGYFNQKMGYSWVDLQAYHRNVANVEKFCADHPQDTVMKVLQDATANK